MTTTSLGIRVPLGRSGLQVSPVCHGTGQLSPQHWGKQPEDTMIAAMRKAFDVGVNFYDTADVYGDGYAEQVLAKGLAGLPRDQVVVATKVFHHIQPDGSRYGDLSRDYIPRACEASLRRLKLDYIDLYQCHSFDPLTPMGDIAEAMNKLVKQGLIRAYGTSNWSVEQMRLGNQVGDFTTCQPFYSLLQRENENSLLPYCQATRTGTLVYSPLHHGLLSGKYEGSETFEDNRKNRPDFQGERFKMVGQRVAEVGPIAQRLGMTMVQLALAATLAHPGIDVVIVGVKSPDQVEDAAGAMGRSLSREDLTKVRSLLTVPRV